MESGGDESLRLNGWKKVKARGQSFRARAITYPALENWKLFCGGAARCGTLWAKNIELKLNVWTADFLQIMRFFILVVVICFFFFQSRTRLHSFKIWKHKAVLSRMNHCLSFSSEFLCRWIVTQPLRIKMRLWLLNLLPVIIFTD